MSGSILIVDDEKDIRDTLQELLQEEGYHVECAADSATALAMPLHSFDAALVDIKIGNDDGIELLSAIREIRPILPVIMITGHGSVSLAAEAFREGAYEFLEKPLRLLKVRTVVRNAVESIQLKQTQSNQERITPVFQSEVMKQLFGSCSRLASLSANVVITGPSGAGKELVAQSLHYEGTRREKPFIAVNAAALPSNLAEDELFGHVKGAFTGAAQPRKGALELAHEGTLFLDEVADLDLTVQAKLLRVLETGRFSPLGSEEEKSVSVRVICATHKNISELISEGKFRQDLWFRLAGFELEVPSLSQRPEDIPVLAELFVERVSKEIGQKRIFTSDALEKLTTFTFEGNVRELKNRVMRWAVLSPNTEITASDISMEASSVVQTTGGNGIPDWFTLPFKDARTTFEIEYFSAALSRNENNITATANEIGMAQSNLSRKIKELGLRK